MGKVFYADLWGQQEGKYGYLWDTGSRRGRARDAVSVGRVRRLIARFLARLLPDFRARRRAKVNINSSGEVAHYWRVVVALKETMRLMGEVDELIPAWPIE